MRHVWLSRRHGIAPPRPHPLARSRVADRLNDALAFLWSRGLSPKPELDPDYLWRIGGEGFGEADEHGGRSPEDVADFRLRLELLCASLNAEAQLNPLGLIMAYGQLTRAIRRRHALGRLWNDRPDLLETALAPPIAVVGQMRAGTTRVHRLLGADPKHCGTRFANSIDPLPRLPGWKRAKAGAALAIARTINPWLETLHPFGANRIDEELPWLAGALSPCAYEAQWHIPSYVAFSEERDAGPVYREFARILRTDAALEDDTGRPRVLKVPQFSEDLSALVAVLPDIRIVTTDRCNRRTLESSVSLVASQVAFQTDHGDLDAIRAEWSRKLALREERMDAALARFDGPRAEACFDALGKDWRAVMRGVYRDLGLTLDEAALTAMEAEQALSERGAHHAHRAQIKQFEPVA